MRGRFDAIIVGAGPAGSTAAILLARAGWSVLLVEKQDFPRRKVCGECISASNLPLLEALGIGSAFAASAGPELRSVVFMHGQRSVEAALPAAAHARYRWGRALGRETLDTLLLEQARLAGAMVLQPWTVQSIGGAPGDWCCEVRARGTGLAQSLRAPIVIDAHGSWEALATGRPQRAPVRGAQDLLAFKANFHGASLDHGVLPVLSFTGGYGGMVVADGALTTVACCIRRDRLEALRRAAPGMGAGAVVEAMLRRECAGVQRALHGATRDGPWMGAGPIAPGIRLDHDDGLFRIGNAAGEAHPILGEGMSMALQSAWLLCAQLLGGTQRALAPAADWQREVARSYARQWRRVFGPRLRLAAVFAQLAMRPRGAALLLALVRAWPGLLTRGAVWGGKVRCAADPAAIALRAPPSVRQATPAAVSKFVSRPS